MSIVKLLMNLLIFLTFIIQATAKVECKFEFSQTPPVTGPYSCALKVRNNAAINDIDASNITGKHDDYMSDQDVLYISLILANVENVPKNLFTRFEKVENFAVINTTLTKLKYEYFNAAKKVENIWFYNNQIEEIENNFLRDSTENLKMITLSNNKITDLNCEAFGELNTLEDLYLDGNLINTLNDNAFCKLHNLYRLDLARNGMKFINQHAFINLSSLQVLYLDSNRMEYFNAGTFVPLKRLKVLSIRANYISHLDKELFESFETLSYVYLSNNRLKFVNFQLPHLIELDLSFNQINAIDTFNSITKLQLINGNDNICVNKEVKDDFLNELAVCIENYRRPKCIFTNDKHNGYSCEVVVDGELQKPSLIYDDHLIGRNNDDVRCLKITEFPERFSLPLIYRNFKNLERIYVRKGSLPDLLQQDFECEKIKIIDFRFIDLKSVEQNIFIKCAGLNELILVKNKIKNLPNFMFNGLKKIKFIDMSFNELKTADLEKFENLSTLTKLFLSHNFITEIREFTFKDLNNLKILKLNDNRIFRIDSLSYLTNLQELHLNHNGLEELLQTENLIKLIYLNLENNRLTKIAAPLSESLQYLDLSLNKINSISLTVINSMNNLNTLLLMKNDCIDENLNDIQFNSLNLSLYLTKCILKF